MAVKSSVPQEPKRRRVNPRRIIVAPSILAANFSDLGGELRRCAKAKCSWIHLDVMDGHFVPNITFGTPVVRSLRKASKRAFLDVHLMIEKPMKFVPEFAEAISDGRGGLINIHQETVGSLRRAIRKIHSFGVMAGVTVKPRTAIASIEPFLDELDLVLVMTVEPGFGGQELIPHTLNKVRRLALLREENKYDFHIQVDGGIDDKTAPLAVAAGANVLVAGSFVFADRRVSENVEKLYSSVDSAHNGHGVVARP